MCGIAGIYKNTPSSVNIDQLKKMTHTLAHRGPDGEGHWLNENESVGFGHRRLSIIDLTDAGKQPMHYKDRYTITYNGEIYNYIEIKNDLTKRGYVFSTNSDTEVLLCLYDYKKEKCLEDLDGMFAFCIWDEVEQKLFCARDRFGEKPFHYFWDGEMFIFASEIKALFAAGVEKKIDFEMVKSFLQTEQVEYGERTFFQNIKKLKQSHFLTIKKNRLSISGYWDVNTETKVSYSDDQMYADKFKSLFTTSIKRRLRSDVPVGSSLSGGLDSSSVVCFINELNKNQVKQKTFSARFYDVKKDEGKWIKFVVDKTNTDHHDVYPDPEEIIHDIEKMLWHHEYPFGSSSICAQWYVMKLAKSKGVTVMLDGQGADEFLSGYESYLQVVFWEYYINVGYSQFARETRLFKKKYGLMIYLGYKYWLIPLFKKLGIFRSLVNRFTPLKEKLRFEVMNNLQELLAYADRNAMAFGIETRLPFLYHELVQFALNCTSTQVYKNASTKYILRKSIEGIVPNEIINRTDKLGYEPPQDEWMKKLYNKEEINNFLHQNGLTESNRLWRNYIVYHFVKVFQQ